MKGYAVSLLTLAAALAAAPALAAGPDDAKGLWMTPEKDGVMRFESCPDKAGALCGTLVWEDDAGTPGDHCGVRIVELARFDGEAWRDGWVLDPRDNQRYSGMVRVVDGVLQLRGFFGLELLGQTEEMTRVKALPAKPVCKL
jgi:uncharacterized protein (DUF2147 family)